MSVTGLAALVTVLVFGGSGLLAVGHFVRKFTKKMDIFLSDWNGEPARPGVPERRGVLVRLEKIEGEMNYNHGTTIKDAVHRIDQNLSTLMAASHVSE